MIRLRRPESHEEEQHAYIGREHQCEPYKLKLAVEGRESAEGSNCIVFPIGHYGQGMPAGQPFEVVSTEPCGACGAYIKTWAEWVTNTIIDLGAHDRNAAGLIVPGEAA